MRLISNENLFPIFYFKTDRNFFFSFFSIFINSETRTNRLTRTTQQLITGSRRRKNNNRNKYESYHPNLFIVCCRMIFTKKKENSQTDYGKRRKTHVRRAVPSRSPIAVRYGMHTLSGSRSCLQTNATIH